MSNFPFCWPVLGFHRQVGPYARPGVEDVVGFDGEEAFSRCDSWSLKHRARQGMLLVDAAGQSWSVKDIRKLGVTGPLWSRILGFLFRQLEYRVEYDLVEEGPMPLERVKARVLKAIDAAPDLWRDDEAIAGEDGPPKDEREMIQDLKERVQRAQDLIELMDGLGPIDPY